MTERPLLCPFDKNPCMSNACAIWSEEERACCFASLPEMVRFLKKHRETAKSVQPGKDTESSGSGKYRTLLFD